MSMNMWSKNASLAGGTLSLAGIPAAQLAKDFGTPSFFLDEDAYRSRALAWHNGLHSEFGPNAGTIYYAAKSFICTAVAQWIADIGIGIDVCTGGELAVALNGGIDPKKIEVHGNNKSVAEIDRAVSVGVKTIVMDSLFEIERVAAAAKKHGVRQAVMLRLTPGIEAHTHEKISTAHEDVKFGFSIASGAAWAAVESVATHPELELLGVHCHIGSQIFGSEAHEIATDRLIGFMAKYRDAYKSELPELDLGGGFGIAYIDGDVTVEPSDVLPQIHAAVKKACAQHNLAIPLVSLEPGRNIVGPTMFTLYEVGTVKDVVVDGGKIRKYVSVDGGMSDNARTALYDAQYTAVIAQRNSTAPLALTRLVGKHCETGDIIINEIQLPSDVAPGDLIATPATGAYGRSMASNYNHVPRPPVVAVKDGKARVIVRRENEADLLSLDVKE
ncbi:diaminopimelate decarboxylase [Candidatus Planktophila dulcis]|uniref:diaminopimelate decarboxylase n=1 Tax=Candidatus Planktophila dulcis TaxID=1884914 RepID=UPI001CBBD87B|nr:diaminopimelate decarboxylase [Candidatus Planktophila dulcis]